MKLRYVIVASVAFFSGPAMAATGSADAGRQLVLGSCTSCHATNTTTAATDGAPPLSFVARDNKQNPAWVRGWLMDPHPPMPGIMLSRRQIDDIVSYLNVLADEGSVRDR